VKSSAQRDNLVLRRTDGSCPPPREFEGAFVRLRSGVAEEHFVGERTLDERGRQLLARHRRVQIRDVNEPVGRGVHRLSKSGVAVAERVHSNATHEIEVALALAVDQVDPLAVDERHRRPLVRAE
jgi:hypothetical protein